MHARVLGMDPRCGKKLKQTKQTNSAERGMHDLQR